ncbi:MAG: hypothetical protein ABJL99_23145 [Aliishimia sp.]
MRDDPSQGPEPSSLEQGGGVVHSIRAWLNKADINAKLEQFLENRAGHPVPPYDAHIKKLGNLGAVKASDTPA